MQFPPTHRQRQTAGRATQASNAKLNNVTRFSYPPNAVIRGQGWVCKSGFIRVGQQCNKGAKTANNNFFGELLEQLQEGKENKKKAVEAAVAVYKQGNFKQALRMFAPLAKKNEPRAQFYMGLMHGKGEGVLKDRRKAAEWFHASAKRNYRFAQFNLANSYRSGLGVTKDYKKSVYWYQRAAKQGHRGALHYLGLAHYLGRGVLKDEQRGLDFIRQSAMKGDRESQYFLGISYCNGKSVILSKRQCAIWIKRAYDRGHPKASKVWEKFELWKHQ